MVKIIKEAIQIRSNKEPTWTYTIRGITHSKLIDEINLEINTYNKAFGTEINCWNWLGNNLLERLLIWESKWIFHEDNRHIELFETILEKRNIKLVTKKVLENMVKDKDIVKHMPLVTKLAKKLLHGLSANVSFDDLYTAGLEGLFLALSKDPKCNNTYIGIRVRGSMIDHLRRMDHLTISHRKEFLKKGIDPICIDSTGNELCDEVTLAIDMDTYCDLPEIVHEALMSLPEQDAQLLISIFFDELIGRKCARKHNLTQHKYVYNKKCAEKDLSRALISRGVNADAVF